MGNKNTQKVRARRKFKELLTNHTERGMLPQCAYCGLKHFTQDNFITCDHVVPISKGGTSHKDNLVVSCLRCNRAKADSYGLWSPKFKSFIGQDNGITDSLTAETENVSA